MKYGLNQDKCECQGTKLGVPKTINISWSPLFPGSPVSGGVGGGGGVTQLFACCKKNHTFLMAAASKGEREVICSTLTLLPRLRRFMIF